MSHLIQDLRCLQIQLFAPLVVKDFFKKNVTVPDKRNRSNGFIQQLKILSTKCEETLRRE